MIKVLIVDDSKVIQEVMKFILSTDPDIEIAGIAGSGQEAVELAEKLKPDVITMDFHMPGINGYEATKIIMETNPTPIVIVSGSVSAREVSNSLRLMEVGALAVVYRPPLTDHSSLSDESRELIGTIKLMSEIKVVRRIPLRKRSGSHQNINKLMSDQLKNEIKLVAIGASTGGPMAIQKIISKFPSNFNVPVLIVQHIAAGFVRGFADWLSASSGIYVKVASDGEQLEPGVAYVAPDNFHMGITDGLRIKLSTTPPENGLRPAVDYMFRSVAEVLEDKAIGILLTGMGKDGAVELKRMKDRGALTIAQDRDSSVIFGMPGEAVRLGAVTHELPCEKIGDFVNGILMMKQS
jgi:two-component system chemotaxis response regulator CheB